MAEDKDKNPPAPAPKTKDLVSEIGTLTYSRAVENFGKDRALSVLHQVAAIGGHGMFEDSDFLSPLFGGLAMPNPNNVISPKRENFASFGVDQDFRYQEAMDDYKVTQEQTAANREKINELYNSLK